MSRIPGWTNVSLLVLRLVLFAGVAVCAQLAGPAGAAAVHYVKANATGAKTGLSWTDAYTDLQAGLAAAEWGDEIWVAQGTYKPTSGWNDEVSFVLKSGVGLYGGFAGTETERGQRNWETNATILSGDIGTVGDATDNSYHVVVGADLAVLDGFTITQGHAEGSASWAAEDSSFYGGGMYNLDCSPTVINCSFIWNTAGGWSAGYYRDIGGGGGMFNSGSSPTVTNCTFGRNETIVSGGGMFNSGSSPTVTNCTFSDNSASDGGGMYNTGGSPIVTNCTFSVNRATYGGGIHNVRSSATVTGCTFTGNSGGGMNNVSGSPTVTNCTFTGNSGGGMCNAESSPTVTSCTFTGNSGGGMFNWGGSPSVTNCTFSGNTASGGGGMYNYDDSSPTVTNCTFNGNTASYSYGGGMYNNYSSPTVTNCTFSGNTAADRGGGMHNAGNARPSVTNCTFSGNTADHYGGGISSYYGLPTVANCTFWDNTAPSGAEIMIVAEVAATFRHCDIKGSGGSGTFWDTALGIDGGGNMDADPRFVAPATPAGPDGLWRTLDDGLRLQSDSPCIGAADPAVAPATDILGLPRSSPPDIGAYEFASGGGSYTLTYNAGAGGSISGTSPQMVNHGASGTAVEALPDAGYHFLQWNDSSAMNPRTDTNVTANISVTANFAINTYTLTYTAAANGSISGTSPQTVNFGTGGTAVTAVPDTGYHFVQWGDGVLTATRADTNVTANISVTANFAINTYTVIFQTDGTPGSTLTGTTPQTIEHDDDCTSVTANAPTGYHFTEWSLSGEDYATSNPLTLTNVTTDTLLTASFAINTYTLTYTAGANGSISGTTPQTVDYGTSGTAVEALPDTGYHFLQWNDSSAMNPRTDTDVTTDVTVTADFAINTYTLTYTAGAHGSISGITPQTVDYGTSGTAVEAVPSIGHHFVQWSDASTANPRTDTNVTTDVTVTATFAINTYTLTYNAGADGSISGITPQTVDYGADGAEVTAVPDTGHRFVRWSDDSTANPRKDTNVTADINVTAIFAHSKPAAVKDWSLYE